MTTRATYDEAKRFVDAVGRPKLPKARPHKPGQRPAPPVIVHLVEDVDRGRVLCRGKAVREALEAAGAYDSAVWSQSAKGYVIDVVRAADVVAATEYLNGTTTWKTFGGEAG